MLCTECIKIKDDEDRKGKIERRTVTLALCTCNLGSVFYIIFAAERVNRIKCTRRDIMMMKGGGGSCLALPRRRPAASLSCVHCQLERTPRNNACLEEGRRGKTSSHCFVLLLVFITHASHNPTRMKFSSRHSPQCIVPTLLLPF